MATVLDVVSALSNIPNVHYQLFAVGKERWFCAHRYPTVVVTEDNKLEVMVGETKMSSPNNQATLQALNVLGEEIAYPQGKGE